MTAEAIEPEAPRRRRADRLVMLGLFLVTLSVFLATTSGGLFSIDGSEYYYTAEALLEGRTDIRRQDAGGVPDGTRSVSRAAPFQAVAEIPALLALRALVPAFKLSPETRDKVLRDWVPNLTSAVLVAGLVVLFFLTVLRLGYRLNIAAAMAALLAFTTPHWFYARIDMSEPLQSFLLVAAFLLLLRAKETKSTVKCEAPSDAQSIVMPALGIGGLVGALLLTKPLWLLVAPVFWLALLWLGRPLSLGRFFKISFACGTPIFLAGLLYLAWNYVRFGSMLDFGFDQPFDTPLVIGLYGLFFSTGKSVFLYAPILLLAVAGMFAFARRHRFEAVVVLALSLPIICLYATFWSWSGDFAWGPRYLVPFVALWTLPVATLLAAGRRAHRVALSALAAAGLFVQVLSVTISPNNYLGLHLLEIGPAVFPHTKPNYKTTLDMVHFNPFFSPIVAHWWLLKATVEQLRHPDRTPEQNKALQERPWRHMAGALEWKPQHPERALGPDMWPFRPPQYLTRRGIRALAIATLLLGLGGALALFFGLRARSAR